jgi:hypothetical protein
MTAKEFITKYEGWFSYVNREKLIEEMESDLQEYAEAKAKEAFEAATEVIDEDITIPSEVWKYKDYETFKQSK